jgi:translation initiation factor 2 beta subunit (eIF-2beta)/eIF-5
MNTKLDILKSIRPTYRSETKDKELFILPSERPIKIDESPTFNNIFDHFEHLIENCDNIGESDKCIEEYIIDMVKQNKHIQSNVRFMLYRCFVPISEIIKVLYNYWGYYTKEECYFLE